VAGELCEIGRYAEFLTSAKSDPHQAFQRFRPRKTRVRKALFCEDFYAAFLFLSAAQAKPRQHETPDILMLSRHAVLQEVCPQPESVISTLGTE
jgi:hypothetical protein